MDWQLGGLSKCQRSEKNMEILLLTLTGEWLVVLIKKDINQAHISHKDVVEQKLIISEVGDGILWKTRGLRKR